MKKKILITGGSGFLGYHIINKSLENDLDVFVQARPSSNIQHLKRLDVKITSFNLADIGFIVHDLEEKKYDFIIHAAGSTKASTQEQYNLVNAEYTANLARAAVMADIPLKKFVFVSSLAALGPLEHGIIDEQKAMEPVTPYGESKKLAEQMLAEIKPLPLITLRPTAVYGPRERDILILIKTFLRGFEPYIGTRPQRLSFVYVKDLADLMMQALFSNVTRKAYNVSDGREYDKYEMAGITKSIIQKKTIRFHLPVSMVELLATILEKAAGLKGEMPVLNRKKLKELTGSWVCSIEAARNDLNYQPKYDLEKGLIETIEWYRQNKWV